MNFSLRMTCLVCAEIVLNNFSDVYIENNFLDLKRQSMMRHFRRTRFYLKARLQYRKILVRTRQKRNTDPELL